MPDCNNEKKPKPKPIRPIVNPYLRVGRGNEFRLGCLKDRLDLRDMNIANIAKEQQSTIRQLAKKLSSGKKSFLLSNTTTLPSNIDLRQSGNFTDIEDQRSLGSCTANAVVGLVEYLIKSTGNKALDLSRIFLYKTTRNLMGDQGIGDSGAYIRDTIKALRLFGVPPEKWWPYDIVDFDDEPDAFIYAYAQNFQAIDYLRLDQFGASNEETLNAIKQSLADGFPSAFGFWVPDTMDQVSADNPVIPVPTINGRFVGGHAVVAVGYDDEKEAILIRNSWGKDWGVEGYAWLPYEYVLKEYAFDFWTIFDNEWV